MTGTTTIRRILFATDFSENSRLALYYAATFAEHFNATIVMLHVVVLSQAAHEVEIEVAGPSASRKDAEHRLDALAEGLRRFGLTVEVHVIDGFAGETILSSLRTYDVDLLVLGIHGLHHGLGYLVLGSTTEWLLRKSPCPILTLGANAVAGAEIQKSFGHILFISDLSVEAALSAPYAVFLAESFRVPLETCVWLPSVPPGNDERVEEYCHRLRNALEDARTDSSTACRQLSRVLGLSEIIAKAEQQTAGLIVLGIQSTDASFVRRILSRANCPVITVRQKAGLQLQGQQ